MGNKSLHKHLCPVQRGGYDVRWQVISWVKNAKTARHRRWLAGGKLDLKMGRDDGLNSGGSAAELARSYSAPGSCSTLGTHL